MMKIKFHNLFKKDIKRIRKRGYNLKLLENIVQKLANEERLPSSNKDHALVGDYEGFRECHITPDWILVYRKNKEELILLLSRTGTHSDLFKK